jgi:predicted phage terminase large subunit-like protein
VREPLPVLENLKRQIVSDAFSAQYQQTPVPPGGAMIKRLWAQRYNRLPPEQDRLTIVQSWDTASKGGLENDYSVCTTWLVTRGVRRWYLIDVWRVDYPELKAAVQVLAAKYKARRVLLEDVGAGTSLVQELRRGKVPGIVAVKAERGKVTRMSVVSAIFESGQVFLPERATWLADFEWELFAFPGVKHDDQCDSVSQALSERNYRFPINISQAVLDNRWDVWALNRAANHGSGL